MTSRIRILPKELTDRWRHNADNRRASWLADMLDLRDFLEEYVGSKEEVYEEAAPAFGVETKTLKNKMSILRSYSAAQLTNWLVVHKLSLDTLDLVNRACANGDIKMTPVEYIEILLNGDGDGKIPTKPQVEQLIAEGTGRPQEYWFNLAGSRFASRWGVKDVSSFLVSLRELIERYK